jgi:hypothetical protein
MKYITTLLLIIATFNLQAQGIIEIQEEIDQTVWKPFQKAFETLDGEALNHTYAKQVLRVTPRGIDTKNAFKKGNIKRFATNLQNGDKIDLDFWFDSRKTNATTSYEVGFYRIAFTAKSAETRYSYGQFHIVLEKIAGHWKITQDWDTTHIVGKAITAQDFELKKPLQF